MSEYLREDQDLLDEIQRIGSMSTGQALSEQQRKIEIIQIKAILRQRKSMRECNVSTGYFSVAFFVLAFVQIVIGLSQLLFDAWTSDHLWKAGAVLLLCCAAIILLLKSFHKYGERINIQS